MKEVIKYGMGRRSFLKTAALATLGTMSAPYIMRANGTSKLKIGVIGCGARATAIPRDQSEDIIPCATLMIVSPGLAEKFPNARYYRDFSHMLERRSISMQS